MELKRGTHTHTHATIQEERQEVLLWGISVRTVVHVIKAIQRVQKVGVKRKGSFYDMHPAV